MIEQGEKIELSVAVGSKSEYGRQSPGAIRRAARDTTRQVDRRYSQSGARRARFDDVRMSCKAADACLSPTQGSLPSAGQIDIKFAG